MNIFASARVDETGQLDAAGVEGAVPWWSFTKTILAIAALRLVADGRMPLDDALDEQGYSLLHLLRHEAGLPDYGGLPDYHRDVAAGAGPWTSDHLLAASGADRLLFEPGTGWSYSNIGYRRVAMLIEEASGHRLGAALDALVFAPVGAASARLALYAGELAAVEMGDVTGYHPGWVYHGLVTGTASDAARLVRALSCGALLRPDLLARMRDGRPLPQHRSLFHPDPAYGLGLMMPDHRAPASPLGHEGSGPGSRIAVYARGGRACATWAAVSSPVSPADQVLRWLSEPVR